MGDGPCFFFKKRRLKNLELFYEPGERHTLMRKRKVRDMLHSEFYSFRYAKLYVWMVWVSVEQAMIYLI
jgi:hypothetical protein